MSPGQMTPRRVAVQHAKTPSKKEANKNDQGEEGIQGKCYFWVNSCGVFGSNIL